jgi:hypothetical protein
MRRLCFIFSLLLVFLVSCSNRPRPEVFSSTPDSGLPAPQSTSTPGISIDAGSGTDIAPEPQEDLSGLRDSPYMGIQFRDYSSQEQRLFFVNSGARLSRFDQFYWDLIEPVPQTPAVYDWSMVDEASLASASEMDIESIGIVLFTPPYAQKFPGSVCGPIAENQLERFGEFLYNLVTRYSQPPYNIKYWELGNEPDVDYSFANRFGFGCWGDPNDPYFGGGYYAQMLKSAYPKIKAANSEAEVLIGGLLLDCDPRNPPETSPGSG